MSEKETSTNDTIITNKNLYSTWLSNTDNLYFQDSKPTISEEEKKKEKEKNNKQVQEWMKLLGIDESKE